VCHSLESASSAVVVAALLERLALEGDVLLVGFLEALEVDEVLFAVVLVLGLAVLVLEGGEHCEKKMHAARRAALAPRGPC
jgi:hypothetical protein